MLPIEDIKKFAKEKGYKDVKFIGVYQGVNIYSPISKIIRYTGYPQLITEFKGQLGIVVDTDFQILNTIQKEDTPFNPIS